jgi:large subunit ribosomal protein L6
MATPTTSQRQSRTGKRPIPVPKGVTVTISGATIAAKGPKGELKRQLHPSVTVKQNADQIVVAPTPASGDGGAQ